jgi:CBS domain-containing protein
VTCQAGDVLTHLERTVGDAMLRHPTLHAADLTVGAARAAFDASPKTHLLLLVRDGMLVSTLTRDDLATQADPAGPAARLGSLTHRTVDPDVPLAQAYDHMTGRGLRRLAVVDSSTRLLGLLCLKRGLTGFCTDDGVAGMRTARDR